MPHEWVSTVTVLALSVLVLSTVTFTTQQYVFSLQDALAEDKLQDITDEVASKVISLYKIGRESDAQPSPTDSIIDIANTRLTLLERTIGNSFYRVVLNNSTRAVEAYLLSDPSVRASTALPGLNMENLDLSGDAWSGNNTFIWYQKRLNQKDLITINNGVFEFLYSVTLNVPSNGDLGMFIPDIEWQTSPGDNPNAYEHLNITITNTGSIMVPIYWISIEKADGDINDFRQDGSTTPWEIPVGGNVTIGLYFGPSGGNGAAIANGYYIPYPSNGFTPPRIFPGETVILTLYFDAGRSLSLEFQTVAPPIS